MKDELENKIIVAIMPFIDPSNVSDVKMRIAMAMDGYDIVKAETALIAYEGDINGQMIKRFLMAKVARGCSARTVKFYRESITKVFGIVGKPYSEVTADDIRLYLAVRVQKDMVSKTTANNERRNLSAFYGWLQKEEIISRNPMSKIEPIKETKKKKTAFSQMDLEKMRMKCSTSMDVALFEVLISTWARVSEIAQMRIDEIQDNRIIVHGKGDKEREVFLSPRAQLALMNYLSDRKDDNPYIFPKAKYAGNISEFAHGKKRELQGEWYKNPEKVGEGHRDTGSIERTIRSIGKKAGVNDAHPHRFRRTGATMALRNGMPLMTVSKMLGHVNIGTTQIYLDISDKDLEQAHEKFVI